MTCVLIIDGPPFVTQGCRRLLEDAGVESILSASNALTGLSQIGHIRANNLQTRVVGFSMRGNPTVAQNDVKAGASEYLIKDPCSAELVNAVQANSTALSFRDADRAREIALRQSPARSRARK
jgi:two-component system, NarL family, invasion response regulator UvrY